VVTGAVVLVVGRGTVVVVGRVGVGTVGRQNGRW